MNKEFLGKKRFYLEDNPKVSLLGRVYIIETRSSEYFSVVLEDGNTYQIEYGNTPCSDCPEMQAFRDLDNHLFFEFPSAIQNNLLFRDKDDNVIGNGELSVFQISGKFFYASKVIVSSPFKYKQNGWDFKVKAGEEIITEMIRKDDLIVSERYQLSCKISEGQIKKLFVL